MSSVVESTKVAPGMRVRAVPISFGAIVVCFFFTFVNISCQGQRVASLTGWQLATGTEVEQPTMFGSKQEPKKVPAEALASIALLLAVVGLVISFAGKATRTLTTVAGAAGAV